MWLLPIHWSIVGIGIFHWKKKCEFRIWASNLLLFYVCVSLYQVKSENLLMYFEHIVKSWNWFEFVTLRLSLCNVLSVGRYVKWFSIKNTKKRKKVRNLFAGYWLKNKETSFWVCFVIHMALMHIYAKRKLISTENRFRSKNKINFCFCVTFLLLLRKQCFQSSFLFFQRIRFIHISLSYSTT